MTTEDIPALLAEAAEFRPSPTFSGQRYADLIRRLATALQAQAGELERERKAPDYYPSHEALHDLVQLLGEESAIGGGPDFKKRWRAAVRRAEEIFEP